jgi:hypothetical protein
MEARRLVVDARLEQHERIAKLLTSGPPPRRARRPPSTSIRVYTLRVKEQPLRTVVQQLVERLQWDFEIDEAALRAAGRSLDVRVTFQVENGDADELLRAMLHPAGLDYRREGERLLVVPLATESN